MLSNVADPMPYSASAKYIISAKLFIAKATYGTTRLCYSSSSFAIRHQLYTKYHHGIHHNVNPRRYFEEEALRCFSQNLQMLESSSLLTTGVDSAGYFVRYSPSSSAYGARHDRDRSVRNEFVSLGGTKRKSAVSAQCH